MSNAVVSDVEISFVIPVFNGSQTIGPLVDRIQNIFPTQCIQIVLINDGSVDNSEQVCIGIADDNPDTVTFIQLSRNFGEHNAVLAGLNHAMGLYVAVLDDDGQNPPEEIPRMLQEIKENKCDVVYGRYIQKQHSMLRNLGSRLTDRVATIMLKKPSDLYLSSFKVMNRFIVDQVIGYQGAFPYIDGLIFRATLNVGQIDVEHRAREGTTSNYTFKKLVGLWLNMFMNFSITPLRVSLLAGLFTTVVAVLLIGGVIVDKLWINPAVPRGVPTILITVMFFAGVQLLILGLIGEYLGRLLLDYSGTPQFVVRYTRGKNSFAPRDD